MHEPLDYVQDASKWHYALQLNLYAYILENFYGFRVARREVACFHPENGSEPNCRESCRVCTSISRYLGLIQTAKKKC